MIFNMIVGGGGGSAGLNFSLVRYDIDAILPETAKENTIAVFSDTEITSYAISDATPEILEDGMVWILNDISSEVEFNALKENTVHVHPSTTKQYVDGAWVSLNAYIYQNEEWIQFSSDFDGYLFNGGSVNEEITGGWTGDSGVTISDTIYGDYYYAPSTIGGEAKTVNMIDLTDYSVVKANCTAMTGYNGFYLKDSDGNRVGEVWFSNSGEISIDLSSISGEYYICFVCSGSQNSDYTIDKVWLE